MRFSILLLILVSCIPSSKYVKETRVMLNDVATNQKRIATIIKPMAPENPLAIQAEFVANANSDKITKSLQEDPNLIDSGKINTGIDWATAGLGLAGFGALGGMLQKLKKYKGLIEVVADQSPEDAHNTLKREKIRKS